MNKKVIIFDMDGVLYNSIDMSYKYHLDLYPGFTKKMMKELLCGNYLEEIKKITVPKKIETDEEKAERKLLYTKNKSMAPMYGGVMELLVKLHKDKYILVLNTSAKNRNCLPLLERSKVTPLFDFLATADVAKSKVEKFKMFEKKYGVKNTDMLFITDTLGDIREADIAGVPTVAVTWGAHDKSYFTREEHKNLVSIVNSIEELENYILQYFI